MSVKEFLQQRAVNISVGGHYTLANWFDSQGKPRTFACRTSRVSPFRMLVAVPVVGKVGIASHPISVISVSSMARSATSLPAASCSNSP
jgi:hypothetical protein